MQFSAAKWQPATTHNKLTQSHLVAWPEILKMRVTTFPLLPGIRIMAEIRIRNYPIISGITCQFVLAKGRGGSKVEKCWVYAKEARAFLANLERQVNKMPQLRRHLRMPLGLVQMQTKAKHEQQQRGTAISNPMPRQMCCKPADFYNNVEFLNTAFDVVSAFEC